MKIQEIIKAAEILELEERATIEKVRSKYKNLLFQWHPDRCKDKEKCEEMTRLIVQSYRIILDYCSEYKYPFSSKILKKEKEYDDPEEFWEEHFGEDPLSMGL